MRVRTVGLSCWLGLLLIFSSCHPLPIARAHLKQGKATVPVSAFEKTGVCRVKVPELEYDLLVRKMGPGLFTAVLLKCTVDEWDLESGKDDIYCPKDGSRFDWMGNVKREPASRRLRSFRTQVSGDSLLIFP